MDARAGALSPSPSLSTNTIDISLSFPSLTVRAGAQWALSRPMLGLILTNPEAFEAIKQVRCLGRLLISIGLENLPETILMG